MKKKEMEQQAEKWFDKMEGFLAQLNAKLPQEEDQRLVMELWASAYFCGLYRGALYPKDIASKEFNKMYDACRELME